jgi:threonine dehydrogenase-like Zn-dependent dehydrogenase
MTPHNLPETYKALLFTSNTSPPIVTSLPTPVPGPGTVLLRPLYASIVAYAQDIFTNGNPRGYKYPLPLVPGSSTIARVAAAASDTSLQPGQLVWTDAVVRARDNPEAKILHGLHQGWSSASNALMEGVWRDGSWAEILKIPAENVHILDEERLVKRLGYELVDLGFLGALAVSYGGLRDVGLRVGETVLIAPATGTFGGGAVHVALALGAGKVVAMGRNTEVLSELKALAPERVETVEISGDLEKDTTAIAKHGPVDVYFDISPPNAGKSTHIKAGISALRPQGRVSMMGGVQGDVELPYYQIMYKGLTLKGSWMYTRDQVKELINMIETGRLKVGSKAGMEVSGVFGLEDWEMALDTAKKDGRMGRAVFFAINQ